MRRSRSPASSCCTAFGRDSSNCHLSAFKVELHLQSGTRCFRPELCAAKQECLLMLAICTRAGTRSSQIAKIQQEQKWGVEGDMLFPEGGYQLSANGKQALNQYVPQLKNLQNARLVVY